MQVVAWIIVILVVLFLIWLLRRWIRRIIFILILLVLAFFIYGIFNPSGAARLWYNVRTFPQRMAGWMGSTKEYLDYNTYKSKISSIGDSIGDTVDNIGDSVDNIGDKIDLGGESIVGELDFGGDIDTSSYDEKEDQKEVKKSNKSDSDKQTIKAFPKSVKFVDIPRLDEGNKNENKSDNSGPLTGYSKSDLIGVINKYIEKNLDDDTDILVTVEYEDDSSDPQKIILQTQKKSTLEIKSDTVSSDLLDKIFDEVHSEEPESDEVSLDEDLVEDSNNQVENIVQPVKKAASTNLTQKEKEEAEEIFGILF